MKTLSNLLLIIVIVGGSILGCKKDAADPTVDCSTSQNRDMEGFFNALHSSPNYDLYETMDLLTHEFTFDLSSDIQICGFGYKSQGTQLNYEIKITDVNGNTVFSQTMNFDNTQYSYVSIPPITLQGGVYTLSRTVLNNSNLSETIGPITRGANNTSPTFPVSLGNLITITSSNFYGSGGPVPDYGIPNIYFEYIEL